MYAFELKFGKPNLKYVASRPIWASGLVLNCVALAFGLAFQQTRQGASWDGEKHLDCVSFGKGGVRCAESSIEIKQPNPAGADTSDCASLGRAGHVCFSMTKDFSSGGDTHGATGMSAN
jgi:hypothetical protein